METRNYAYFLDLYVRHIEPIAETFAYCLMKNHFHLLVRIKDCDNLLEPSRCFSNLFNAYARAFNRSYGRTGALFQRPFSYGHVLPETHRHAVDDLDALLTDEPKDEESDAEENAT